MTDSSDLLAGRWDVTVEDPDVGSYPSWFEFEKADGGLKGRFVGQSGSARPIVSIELSGDQLTFRLPPQYENKKDDLVYNGRVGEGSITGTANLGTDSREVTFSAVPQPPLDRPEPEWSEPIQLIQDDLSNWRARTPDGPNGWSIENGVLVNKSPSGDLITNDSWNDFKLSLEFKYPEKSNSGVYLRGRYEVQVQDDHGKEPHSLLCGGVYGFVTPTKMAAKPANEWNTYEMTLVGRRLTLVFNGETIIDDEEIPGITGGALDSDEAAPGPLMLQGDHGDVQYRNVVLTPAASE